jgi:hypothetical protein
MHLFTCACAGGNAHSESAPDREEGDSMDHGNGAKDARHEVDNGTLQVTRRRLT